MKFLSVSLTIFFARLYGVNLNINGKILCITPVITIAIAIKLKYDIKIKEYGKENNIEEDVIALSVERMRDTIYSQE